MKIENAKLEDLQEGDVIDLHGLVFEMFDGISGDLCVQLPHGLSEMIDRDAFKSLTIHRNLQTNFGLTQMEQLATGQ